MNPSLAEVADALLSVLEGAEPRLKAFQDGGGVWTIGRGHTKNVRPGDVITRETSRIFFAEDEAPLLELAASSGRGIWCCAAYVSFGYNCGAGALHAVLTGHDTIDNPRHTTDRHGVVEPGLVARRRLEFLLTEIP